MSKNHLSEETSPYLLQHKDNPVNWYGWNEQAFEQARKHNKPVLLSIGYAACHWCHVMAHESFEDPTTAEIMNQHFINIKVDREERPDIDRIYMAALHGLGEQGGWPLTMFLTPDALPFWGGTYFPPESKYGRPGFRHVLTEISRIWNHEPHKIAQNAEAITHALQQPKYTSKTSPLLIKDIHQNANILINAVDPHYGGLKGAPKFPQAPVFSFLWEIYLRGNNQPARDAVLTTLDHISNGGIYDHLGGGLARYSTDHKWLAPHFEKMLYDNAQYVSLLTRAWLTTKSPLYETRINETIAFVFNEMTTSAGCFTSSYDADSEGEEGKYYVWSKAEIEHLLEPSEAQLFCKSYDVTAEGNWEGHNILNRSNDPGAKDQHTEERLKAARSKLLDTRKKRIPPQHDDKILADWNGLFITGLAEAALVFDNTEWAKAAIKSFDASMSIFWQDKRLLHSHRLNTTRHEAIADDYANLIEAALALHALTSSARYISIAQELAASLEHNHWDKTQGGFFHASIRSGQLPISSRTIEDDATPNANGVMIKNYTSLYVLTGNAEYNSKAEEIIAAFNSAATDNPFGTPSMLKGAMLYQDTIQLVLSNDDIPAKNELLKLALQHTGLNATIHVTGSDANISPDSPAFSKATHSSMPTLYICRAMTCANPATNSKEVTAALQMLGLLQAF